MKVGQVTIGMIGLVVDRDIAAMRGQPRASTTTMASMRAASPDAADRAAPAASSESGNSLSRVHNLAPARAVNIGQHEARQHEEELDPEITLADGQIEPSGAAIAMPLAIVKQHEDQRRKRARRPARARISAGRGWLIGRTRIAIGSRGGRQSFSAIGRAGGAAYAVFHLQSLLGIVMIIAVAWLLSENRRAFPFRTVVSGLGLQFAPRVVLLKVPAARSVLFSLNGVVDALTRRRGPAPASSSAMSAARPPPFAVTDPQRHDEFRLPDPAAGDRHLGAGGAAVALADPAGDRARLRLGAGPDMGIGGAVGLGSAATVFFGMVEAPLLIRPYLARMSRVRTFHPVHRRPGDHRRHGLRALRDDPRARHSRRARPYPGGLVHVAARRHPDRPHHDPRRRATPTPAPRRLRIPLQHGCHRAGHRRRSAALARHRLDADRHRRAGGAGQHHPRAICRRLSAHRSPSNGSSAGSFAPVVWLYGVPWHEAPRPAR